MKKTLAIIVLLIIGFSAAATEIGLELVSHLEIETQNELDVVMDLGMVSLYSSEDLGTPFWGWYAIYPYTVAFPWIFIDYRKTTESYTDIYLSCYGKDRSMLLSSAIPLSEVNIGFEENDNLQEVYLYRGNVIGRDKVATILGMDDYFNRKNLYATADYIDTWSNMGLVSGSIFLVAGLINSDTPNAMGAVVVGGVFCLLGLGGKAGASAVRPDEPLWDHDQVRREIIKYNNQLLSAAE